ncbi:hypothetical protein DFH09DRAFT_1147727 [Mycena vulgaris]|nr:hypothetical protein DFH09DRAFT_1147727 [Mycena vulgaris]
MAPSATLYNIPLSTTFNPDLQSSSCLLTRFWTAYHQFSAIWVSLPSLPRFWCRFCLFLGLAAIYLFFSSLCFGSGPRLGSYATTRCAMLAFTCRPAPRRAESSITAPRYFFRCHLFTCLTLKPCALRPLHPLILRWTWMILHIFLLAVVLVLYSSASTVRGLESEASSFRAPFLLATPILHVTSFGIFSLVIALRVRTSLLLMRPVSRTHLSLIFSIPLRATVLPCCFSPPRCTESMDHPRSRLNSSALR